MSQPDTINLSTPSFDYNISQKSNTHKSLIPLDKCLSEEWQISLTSKGDKQVYSGDELDTIGMPIGGICTGQVYLGGDGKLWHWDIFKDYGGAEEHADPRGPHYATPLKQQSPIEQGFALKLHENNETKFIALDKTGFTDITFNGRYPIGYVNYSDQNFPVTVALKAYSPFIPLDAGNSGLPITLMEYTIKNSSDSDVSLSILGWLENKICPYDNEKNTGFRKNEIIKSDDNLVLNCNTSVEKCVAGTGSMSLCLLDSDNDAVGGANVDLDRLVHYSNEDLSAINADYTTESEHQLIGAIQNELNLKPGETKTIKFAISWFFPEYTGGDVLFSATPDENFYSTMEFIPELKQKRRFYASMFKSSQEVVNYVAKHYQTLSGNTNAWVDTWYDSTLPEWLLDRTFLNISTLATGTCHRFEDGRFWAWEGVDSCPGTCQHVWNYAQAVARLFPELERNLREVTDYGVAYTEGGALNFRAEASIWGLDLNLDDIALQAIFATDGQLGTILRVYREHTMTANNNFLIKLWPKVKKSLQFMMTQADENSGLINTPQYNTLDVTWHGKIPWISSLYLAALAAGKQMACEVEDKPFASLCDIKLTKGKKSFVDELYNGEYFIHKADKNHPESMQLTEGSYIDQVFGQGYAMQLGLERVIPKKESCSALNALWKYNFTCDVGPYRDNFTDVAGGRWYAMAGEGGMFMCTWPKDDCYKKEPVLLGLDVTSEGYLNECMTGFEYQAASHMVAEGLVEKGLAIARTIHDRYHASKRNPWNEVECGDHYSRAMASYGVFINICGYQYHGPKGELSFHPKLTPENFKSAFTVAQGWGSYTQTFAENSQKVDIKLAYGKLCLNKLSISRFDGKNVTSTIVKLDNQEIASSIIEHNDCIDILFEAVVTIATDQDLTVEVNYE